MNKKLIAGAVVVVAVVAIVGGTALMKNNDTTKNNSNSGKSESTSQDKSSSSSGSKTSSNGSTSGENGMNMQQSGGGTSGSTGDAVATSKVTIKDFAFSPATIKVKAGTTVTWTNQDSTQHTVTVDSGVGPRSQPLDNGDSYSYTFAQSGTYTYKCTFHPNMTGKVIVE